MLLERLLRRIRAHDDERHFLEPRVTLEFVADGKAVHPRQFDRQKNEIGLVGRRRLEPDARVVDDRYRATPRLELPLELAGEYGIAFEDQYVRHGQILALTR